MAHISKEDFLQVLEQIDTNGSNTPDLTPISGQIFFGTDFANLVSTHQINEQQTNGSINSHSPNSLTSPNQQTTSSNGGKFIRNYF